MVGRMEWFALGACVVVICGSVGAATCWETQWGLVCSEIESDPGCPDGEATSNPWCPIVVPKTGGRASSFAYEETCEFTFFFKDLDGRCVEASGSYVAECREAYGPPCPIQIN